MSTLNGNGCYLTIAGTNYSAYFVSFKMNGKNAVKEITAGSGTTHIERAAGLNDYSADVVVVYETTLAAQQFGHYSPGDIVAVEYGPEGNTTGKPRHVQNFIVEEAPFEQTVEKEKVAFELKLNGSEAPSVDIYSGAVY